MDCLKDYIGIKGCGLDPVDSGMYINSLPGIEFAQIQSIADADQNSFLGVWADVQERAAERFKNDVLGEISGFDKRYRLRQITQGVDLGRDLTNVITPAFPAESGLVIELKNPGDQCVCSNMQSLYVQSVQFYCVNAGQFTLTVRDADYGDILDTYTVTGVQGWNVIKTDKQYDDVMRLSITVDTTNIDTNFLDLSQFNLQQFGQLNWCTNCGYNEMGLFFVGECTGTAQVRGITTDLNGNNPVFGVNTYGVSCVFSVRCTWNNIVCKNKRHFANAFRLLLGIELMTERLYTSRINKYTTVTLERAAKLRKEFEVQYRGGQLEEGIIYEGELTKAIAGIEVDLSDCCIECDAPIMWRETQL